MWKPIKLRCSKADPKPSIFSIGTSIRFVGTDGSSHTLGRSLGPIMTQLVVLSCGHHDERFKVDGETNIILVVSSVTLRLFQARRFVVGREKWLNALCCCASESCSTAKLSFTYDAVQTPSARHRPRAGPVLGDFAMHFKIFDKNR